MSLYAQYIKELRNDECIESDKGFCTYRYLNDNQVYIIDIFILPKYRNTKEASNLADLVVKEAKIKGCKEVLGTVVPTAKNSTASLKVLLGYGMQLDSATDNVVLFKKDIL